MGRKILLPIGELVILLVLLSIGLSVADEPIDPDLNMSLAEPEFTIPAEVSEMADAGMPFAMDQWKKQGGFMSGTGNLTELIEMNNSAGDYSYGFLSVIGTGATQWNYQTRSSNQTGDCYVTMMISVKNAEKVLFEGHAISPDNHVAYTGTGLQEEEWKTAGLYSGTVSFGTVVHGDMSTAFLQTESENGTITHLTRAYHVVNCSSSDQAELRDTPGLQWNPALNETALPTSNFCYTQYAGSYISTIHGGVDTYDASARSGPKGAISFHNQVVPESQDLMTNTLAEEWHSGNMTNPGRDSYEEIRAHNLTSLTHTGYAEFMKENSVVFGRSEGTAGIFDYKTIQSGTDNTSSTMNAYTGGRTDGITGIKKYNDRMSIPASFVGLLGGYTQGKMISTTEGYTTSGALSNRFVEGGAYIGGDGPITGVIANMTVGNDKNPTGASGLQGFSTFTSDGNADNTTVLDGRWIARSPVRTPIMRGILAKMPGNSAYSTSTTVAGTKNIKESGYYRSGMVDVI